MKNARDAITMNDFYRNHFCVHPKTAVSCLHSHPKHFQCAIAVIRFIRCSFDLVHCFSAYDSMSDGRKIIRINVKVYNVQLN